MKTGPGDPAWPALLAYLSADGKDPSVAYEEIRRRLVTFFRCHRVPTGEDLADVAFDRVARRLLDGVVSVPPRAYFLGVARNLLREHWRRPEGAGLDEATEPLAPPQPEPAPALDCLDECLGRLDASERDAIVAYYQGSGGEKIARRKRLARDEGTSLTALRMRMLRLRSRIELEVAACVESRQRDGTVRRDMGD